jgi:hypothetical protein
VATVGEMMGAGAIQHWVAEYLHHGGGTKGIAAADERIRQLFPDSRWNSLEALRNAGLRTIDAANRIQTGNPNNVITPPNAFGRGRTIEKGRTRSPNQYHYVVEIEVDVTFRDKTTGRRATTVEITSSRPLTNEEIKQRALQRAKMMEESPNWRGKIKELSGHTVEVKSAFRVS